MSTHDYSRNKARSGPFSGLAAPSAFGFSYGEAEVEVKVPQTAAHREGTHFMAGDESKIFNPKTGKYVKIDGKVGQDVIAEFGYPLQSGGNTFDDISNQLSKSFSDLYDTLASTWNTLTSTTATASKSSRKASTKVIEPQFQGPKSGKRNNRPRNNQY